MCCEAPPVSSSHRLSLSCAHCVTVNAQHRAQGSGAVEYRRFSRTAHRSAARVLLSFGIMHSTRVMDWEEVHRQPPPDRR